MTIWKFLLQLADMQGIDMPAGANIIAIDNQYEHLAMWAIVDPGAARETRWFTVVGTGHLVPPGGSFLGSVQMRGGQYVWHVFEVRAPVTEKPAPPGSLKGGVPGDL